MIKTAVAVVSLGLVFLLASCSTGSYTTTDFSTASVEVIDIDPSPGAAIDDSTQVTATIRYSINNFKAGKGRYSASITFAAKTPEKTFRTHNVGEGRAKLKTPRGEVKLTYRMLTLKEREDLQLAEPVRLKFIVTEKSGSKGRSKIIGSSDFVTY